MTPSEALAAWEAADARKRAAKQEQFDADAAWVKAAEVLAEAIQGAVPEGSHLRETVIISGKLVRIEWDDYWTVAVTTPQILD